MKRIIIMLALGSAVQTAAAQTTIEFWHTFGDVKRGGWIQDRADEFNKLHPDLKVIPSFKGGDNELISATILSARQGNPPAISQIFEGGSQLALDSGVFQPVSAIKNVDFSDYIKPVLNFYTISGKVNSLPFNSSSPVLYYNKTLMQKAGLNPLRPPTTFGAMLDDCKKIKAANIGVTCFGMSVNGWFIENWLAEQNQTFLNNNNGRSGRATASNLDSAAAKTIFNFFKTLQDNNYYSYTGKLEDYDGSDAIFNNQKVVFHITSTSKIGNNSDAAKRAGFSLGVARLPIPDNTRRNGVVLGGASLWIAKNLSKEKAEGALDFALYMTNTKNMASWHQLTGYYPVRQSSINLLKEQGWFAEAPLQLVAFNQQTNTIPSPATAGALNGAGPETRKITEQALQKVLNGTPVDAALSEAKARVDAALSDYNANFK
ncbi:ABC transporter substrate-binding protein [Deinococcus rubellus]|uniref:ABC transporter substrate-binding protein n=1 Tax=Deinococcus rubellus TaxID=1889240 RepID=A0ABY5YD11_9DEIO|nr:ABC transporter substrate-binding protein [Deinococcus rubellus]UWX62898.1 ABC transporter substrate-binding protein [Deinococcus rubellus]